MHRTTYGHPGGGGIFNKKDALIHAPRRARTSAGARGIGGCGEGRVKSAKRFYETVFALLHPRIPSLRLRIHFEIPKYQIHFEIPKYFKLYTYKTQNAAFFFVVAAFSAIRLNVSSLGARFFFVVKPTPLGSA